VTPRLVCFDLGGVLVRLSDSWADAARAAGLEARVEWMSDARLVEAERLHDAHQRGDIACGDYLTALSELVEFSYDVEEIARLHMAWLRGTYHGVAELVRDLHERGIATGILSNTNATHWAFMLEAYEPLTLVQHPLASHLLRVRKPDRAIYAAAEARLPASGSEILFFDDLPENVEAARAHGWQAEVIDPARETVPQMRALVESRRSTSAP